MTLLINKSKTRDTNFDVTTFAITVECNVCSARCYRHAKKNRYQQLSSFNSAYDYDCCTPAWQAFPFERGFPHCGRAKIGMRGSFPCPLIVLLLLTLSPIIFARPECGKTDLFERVWTGTPATQATMQFVSQAWRNLVAYHKVVRSTLSHIARQVSWFSFNGTFFCFRRMASSKISSRASPNSSRLRLSAFSGSSKAEVNSSTEFANWVNLSSSGPLSSANLRSSKLTWLSNRQHS